MLSTMSLKLRLLSFKVETNGFDNFHMGRQCLCLYILRGTISELHHTVYITSCGYGLETGTHVCSVLILAPPVS